MRNVASSNSFLAETIHPGLKSPVRFQDLNYTQKKKNVTRSRKQLTMAQKTLNDASLEIEEFDKANNLVATYIKSPATNSRSRIDMVVRLSSYSCLREIEVNI